MAKVVFKGNPVSTLGYLPEKGKKAMGFTLTGTDLNDISLADYIGKKVVLNIFHSLDTSTCAASVRRFNKEAQNLENTVILGISMDLPFAHKRFCVNEGLENVITASAFRNPEFGRDYGVTITEGPMRGLLSRSVVIINENAEIIYTEQVHEISEEPDYEAALKALKE